MLEKVKKFAKNAVQSVKNAFAMKKAEIKGCAHAAPDGTVAEGYVDTGVKILIA